MRVDSRIDANQPEIVEELRKAGCQIQYLHTIGHGCPDLLVGYDGQLAVLEIKAPRKGLTEAERLWHIKWTGFPVYVVRSPEQALAAMGIERSAAV